MLSIEVRNDPFAKYVGSRRRKSDLLCVGFLNEGCRLYTAFVKTFAGCSFSCSSKRKTSIFHNFIGNPSISGGLSLYRTFISL